MSEKSLSFPQVGPDLQFNSEHKGQNGVTYTWNTDYSSWMIGSSQQVNKDYVDSKDQLRLRTDGGNHMFSTLIIRETADAFSELALELTNSGSMILYGNKNIMFVGDGGSISVTNNQVLTFSNSKLGVNQTIEHYTGLTTLHTVTTTQNKTIKLFDINSSNNVKADIDIATGSTAAFRVTKSGSSLLSVGSDGQTYFSAGSNTNVLNAYSKFFVRKDGEIHTTESYNNRLISSNNSTISVPDHAVATKGYADSQGVYPGVSIVANSENEAEVGGFWRSGNNIYLRIA